MYLLIEKLFHDLDKHENIAIYGIGMYAKDLYSKLCEYGWKNKISFFVVTELKDEIKLDEIPVIEVNKLQEYKKVDIIVIATSKLYEDEILLELKKIKADNILKLSNYVRFENIWELFRNASIQDYCEYITEWRIYNNIGLIASKNDLYYSLLQSAEKRLDEKFEDKLIVYILGFTSARALKIIKSLQDNGFRILILQEKQFRGYVCDDELTGIEIEMFECIEEMLYLAMQYRPKLYFIDPPGSDCTWAAVMIQQKKYFGKIVFASMENLYRVFTGLSENWYDLEKYSIENSDGVVWRYFIKEYYEDVCDYRINGTSIQFLDYCDDMEIEKSHTSNILRICYIVSHIEEHLKEKDYDNKFVELATFDEIMNMIGNTGDCIFHVYSWYADKDCIKKLDNIKDKYKNFDYFINIQHKELIGRLTRYDYGSCIFTDGVIPVYPQTSSGFIDSDIKYTEGSYRYSVANRYFDYIEAELPIITTLPEKLCKYLSKYGVIVPMNIGNFDLKFLKDNKNNYKEKVLSAKKELLVSNQIQRLINFFNEI